MKSLVIGLNFLIFGLSSLIYFIIFISFFRLTGIRSTIGYSIAIILFIAYLWIFLKIHNGELGQEKNQSEIFVEHIIKTVYYGSLEAFIFIIALNAFFQTSTKSELFAVMIYVIFPLIMIGMFSTMIFRIQMVRNDNQLFQSN